MNASPSLSKQTSSLDEALKQPMQNIDTLIDARWIIPVEPIGCVLENHSLAIKDGRILAILPQAEAKRRYHAIEHVHLDQHLLIPGLVNLHCHAAMALLRGYADDLPLMEWLTQHIWPAETRFVSEQFVEDGSLLAGAEMLRGGITCVNDMYFYPQATARAMQRLGMRAALGLLTMDLPTSYASDADDYLSKGLATRDLLRNESLFSFCLAPHSAYSTSDAGLKQIRTLAHQLDLPIHMHLHETRQEIDDSLQQHGMRPLQRLQELGLLDPHLLAVHAVHLDANEIELMARHGVSVAHCPTSNLKLASGIAPVAALRAAGVRVGLGTDGAASNNRLSLLQEMNLAALLAKGVSADARVLHAHEVLHMATLAGAEALGLDQEIGSLLPGKAADLCAIRLDEALLQPCYEPLSHLIYVVDRHAVSHVWVAGEKRVENGTLPGLDNRVLLDIATMWQSRMLK